ncbi:hypothetical protein RO3G_14300 [Rhizopus delemar RA 99-880]|uniref:Uncharacterized protein n=1 Tax=Rhizopus delemar (strain RA 99-880 / ATCC MYA-4621 / FGSC 9543 / NRRL 43880) TaxID=246409 RepID=I1CMA9_RHIO9|nr:hypothetical protein RO3G_14300 [Rhizopus delemar RA 99-880]|eukprot:EIE89589.1 hypothetical protein RO3G_14300 [Rhizopus delemar RA 99-880]
MVEKVFVSFKTSTNDPIMNRDLDDDKKVLEEIDADGNTQGLTTNEDDLLTFLRRKKGVLY